MNLLSRLCQALSARRGLVILGGILLCLALIIYPLILRYHRIADVQNSVHRNYEIVFNDQDRPERLPEYLDEKIAAYLRKQYGHRTGRSNEYVLRTRWRAVFRGKIRRIDIGNCRQFDRRLGEALGKFKHLEELRIGGRAQDPEAADALFEAIAKMDKLERLELVGTIVGDAEVAQLASHPGLKTLHLQAFSITARSIDFFKQMPALEELDISILASSLSDFDTEELERSLPGVRVYPRFY